MHTPGLTLRLWLARQGIAAHSQPHTGKCQGCAGVHCAVQLEVDEGPIVSRGCVSAQCNSLLCVPCPHLFFLFLHTSDPLAVHAGTTLTKPCLTTRHRVAATWQPCSLSPCCRGQVSGGKGRPDTPQPMAIIQHRLKAPPSWSEVLSAHVCMHISETCLARAGPPGGMLLVDPQFQRELVKVRGAPDGGWAVTGGRGVQAC